MRKAKEANTIDIEILGSRGRIKILKTLHEQGEINITRIVKMTNLNHKSVEKHLKYLVGKGIVHEKRVGRIKLYSINYSSPTASIILRILDNLTESS